MAFLLRAQPFPQDASWFGEQRLVFWSALYRPRFNPIGADRENHLGYGSENNCMTRAEPGMGAKAQILFEGVDHLQRGLETQLPGKDVGETSRLGHRGAHQVVGEQVRRDLLLDHFRALAAENFHLHDRLDRTKVEFDLPALAVQIDEFLFADCVAIEQRGHQGQVSDTDFSHDDRFWHGGVGVSAPEWTGPARAHRRLDSVCCVDLTSATPQPGRLSTFF